MSNVLQAALVELRERRAKIDRAIEVIEEFSEPVGKPESPKEVRPAKSTRPNGRNSDTLYQKGKKKVRYSLSRGRLHECMLAIGAPASIQEIRDGLKKGFLIQVTEKTVLGLFELNPKMFKETDNGLWLAVRRVG